MRDQVGLTGLRKDLDYADDVCLLSHPIHQDMQRKLERLEEALKVELKINCGKAKQLTLNIPILRDLYINNTKSRKHS